MSIRDIIIELDKAGYDIYDLEDLKMGLGAYLGFDAEDARRLAKRIYTIAKNTRK